MLEKLKQLETVDLVIIGGGSTGSGEPFIIIIIKYLMHF
jgi:hypothetical protein